MFAPGQTVLVAVSGGPDSVALLHALHTLRDELGILLRAAHLDHGFRGAESAADAEYVRALCEQLDVPVTVEFIDVPALKKELHLSAQEAARKARHAFLRRAAADAGADRIALGHTRDDRIETVLLNLLRGTGLEGLGGFPPINPPLVRPLYDLSRRDVLEYCAANALQPRLDSSNVKLDYRRNRIRTELIPHLAAHYNEKVGDALLRMAELASADNSLLEQLAEEALSQLLNEDIPSSPQIGSTDGGQAFDSPLPKLGRGVGGEGERGRGAGGEGLALNTQRLNAHPPALRRRILRRAIARARGSLLDIRFETLETLLAACERGEKVALDLPDCEAGQFSIRTGDGTLIVFRREAQAKVAPWQVVLPVSGSVALPHAGIVVQTVICERYEEVEAQIRQRDNRAPFEKAGVLLFPLEGLRPPLVARSWQAGDRMRPRGMAGTKKLQDIFTDRKIPRERRALLPVIAETVPGENGDASGNGRILAVVGVQSSDAALPLPGEANEPEKIGPFLLLMALSTGVAS